MSIPQLLTGLGTAFSIFLAGTGSSVACSYAGLFAERFDYGLKGFLPLAIAGVLSVYGMIVAVILTGKMHGGDDSILTESDGYRSLSAGLTVGLACLCSGFGMGHFLKLQAASFHSNANTVREGQTEPLLHVNNGFSSSEESPSIIKTVFVLIFHEAIGLYGLIIALMLLRAD